MGTLEWGGGRCSNGRRTLEMSGSGWVQGQVPGKMLESVWTLSPSLSDVLYKMGSVCLPWC